VVVVNETFVRREFDGEDPIGKRLLSGNNAFRIVGVAADARYFDLRREVPPACYLAARQIPPQHLGFVLRTSGDPASLAPAARQAVGAVDPAVAPVGIITMDDQVAASVATERVATLLLSLFALSALLLAAVGLYGVMSYQVLRRQREIGIRMAMGAEAGLLLRLVVSEGMRLSLLGVVLGLMGALALTRLMGSLLYGIAPWDPLTLVGVALLMGGVSFLATWIPARRASHTDPVRVLRSE
jgi:predicted lysophospholipase L1 biosynthesis ABC-type transport system permease subunit